MNEEHVRPDPQAQIVSLDERRLEALEAERMDELPTEGEALLLNEGLDLLAAYKRISDPKLRALVKALADGLASAASRKID